MITQAFRFAYEPFVFGKSKDKDNRETYAQAMKFYVIFTLLAFLCVMGYLDVLKFIIGQSYWGYQGTAFSSGIWVTVRSVFSRRRYLS